MFDSHDVGRNRGGLQKALENVMAKTLVIGITSDILFPPIEQERIAQYIPEAKYVEIDSTYGHDGFLIEFEGMTNAIADWEKEN